MCQLILPNFIGAFFGFLFAIIIELFFNYRKENEIQRKVKSSLDKELIEIYNKLKNVNGELLYLRYDIVVWQACVNSGYLFSVSGKKVYDKYIDIYTKISFANDIEEQYYSLRIRDNDTNNFQRQFCELLNEERIERRKVIQKEIEETINR